MRRTGHSGESRNPFRPMQNMSLDPGLRRDDGVTKA
jgi:hypothetical protein